MQQPQPQQWQMQTVTIFVLIKQLHYMWAGLHQVRTTTLHNCNTTPHLSTIHTPCTKTIHNKHKYKHITQKLHKHDTKTQCSTTKNSSTYYFLGSLNAHDWIGLYTTSAVPGTPGKPSLWWTYTNGNPSGNVTIPVGVITTLDQFVVRYFKNDGMCIT